MTIDEHIKNISEARKALENALVKAHEELQ